MKIHPVSLVLFVVAIFLYLFGLISGAMVLLGLGFIVELLFWVSMFFKHDHKA
ncbi:MAG: hypothetical protein AAF662_01350 [Pseudomonadota bacterium]